MLKSLTDNCFWHKYARGLLYFCYKKFSYSYLAEQYSMYQLLTIGSDFCLIYLQKIFCTCLLVVIGLCLLGQLRNATEEMITPPAKTSVRSDMYRHLYFDISMKAHMSSHMDCMSLTCILQTNQAFSWPPKFVQYDP